MATPLEQISTAMNGPTGLIHQYGAMQAQVNQLLEQSKIQQNNEKML